MRGGLVAAGIALLALAAVLALPPAGPGGGGAAATTTTATTTAVTTAARLCDTYAKRVVVPEDPDPPGRQDFNIKFAAVAVGCDVADITVFIDYEPEVPHSAGGGYWTEWRAVDQDGSLVAEWEGPGLVWDAPDSLVSGRELIVTVRLWTGPPP